MKRGTLHRLRLLSCAALSACAGGGVAHSLNPPAITAPGSSAGAKATAPLAIRIVLPTIAPKGTRRPGYVGAGTQSVTVVVTPSGGTAGPSQLISCSAGTCSGTVGAPVGSDTVTVNLYDQPSGGGYLLSTGTTTVVVAVAESNAANLTFNPVVASASASLSGATFNPGTPSTASVAITLKDADNNTIIGPGSPIDVNGNPVTVTLASSEAGGNTTTSVSPTTINSLASLSATVSYNGNSLYGGQLSVTTNSASVATPAPSAYTIGPWSFKDWSTPTGGSGPWDITVGPDGNLWFSEYSVGQIGRVTTSAGFAEYQISNGTTIPWGAAPLGIAAGSDGRLWFADSGNAMIGAIKTNGTGIVEYSVAAGFPKPSAITAGPDGNLWFVDSGNNSIGVMSTSGTLLHNYTGFAMNAFSAWNIVNIVVGPDHNLWATEQAVGQVARITTTGSFNEFPVPAGAGHLAAGPDGNIWVANNGAGVSVLSTSGTVLHTYGNPGDAILAGADTACLFAGNDGNMWITDWNDALLYRMTTGNFVSSIATGTNPGDVKVGPDGNLWITEVTANKIGRITY